MRLSQDHFDEVVKENVEEFDMTLEEAVDDAVKQLKSQGHELNHLVTSIRGQANREKIVQEIEKLNESLELESLTQIEGSLKKLISFCKTGEDEKIAAVNSGALGAAAFVCRKFQGEKAAVLSSLSLLEIIFENSSVWMKEAMPGIAMESMVEILHHYDNDHLVIAKTFSVFEKLCKRHEDSKKVLDEKKISMVLTNILTKASTNFPGKTEIVPVLKFMQKFCLDDDRRPGVHPNTFIRARNLGVLVVAPLVAVLRDVNHDKETLIEFLFTLKCVAVNDHVCKLFLKENGVNLSINILAENMHDKEIIKSAIVLIRTVSRNDDIRAIVGKGDGLLLVLKVLEDHILSQEITDKAVMALDVLSLRNPDNCGRITELGGDKILDTALSKYGENQSIKEKIERTMKQISRERY